MADCTARTRSGTPCKRPAGWGTDHPGVGRCKLHGGASPIRNPAAVKTTELARYRAQNQPDLRELLAKFEGDPDPLNVRSELAVLRAVLDRTLERMGGTCPTCKRPADELVIPGLIDGISKVVERIDRARAARSISLEEMVILLRRFALVVKNRVRDKETLEAIACEWDAMRVTVN